VGERSEGPLTSLLGQLVTAQERAKGILLETEGGVDRTFVEAAIGTSPFAREVTADVAVIFNSLFGKGEEISFGDVRLAVDFQDYLDSLGYEVRRKTRRIR
jgi:hypothetical protein